MIKRVLSVLLAVTVLFFMVSSCAGTPPAPDTATTAPATTASSAAPASAGSEAPETPDGSGPVFNEPGVLPITNEDITISVGIRQSARCSNYDKNDYTKAVEDDSGVKLTFELFPTDENEATQKLELMVSANQTLPDVLVNLGLKTAAQESYGKQGFIIDIREYVNTLTYFWKIQADKWCTTEERDNLVKLGLTAEGKMYAFPYFYSDPTDPQAYAAWINKAWMDKGGLEMPKTTDEFYTVLVAFRDNDFNGNGKSDEIPLIGSRGWVSNPLVLLMNAFIYWNPTYHFNVENGKLYAPFVTEDFREGLRYIRKLVAEGLLNELSFSQSPEDHRAMTDLSADQDTIVGTFVAHPQLMFDAENSKHMEFACLPPLTGPKGVSYVPKDIPQSNYNVFITGSCKYPEVAFRLLDTMCKEELSITCRFGPIGTDWWYVEDPNAKSFMGTKAVYDSPDKTISMASHSANWCDWATAFIPPTLFGSLSVKDTGTPETLSFNELFYGSVMIRMDKNPSELVPTLNYTFDEITELTDIRSTIDNYYQECATLFVTGVMDIESEWDQFVAELDSIGLARYLEIAQQCYDRMNSI